ncbi:helix-turn-helix domain-containing protein [Flavobacterium sp. NKUCC04_CG]|uniref:AraC family transcriptional regulator n=1 Tax=Flavobacterium sp. NKUCC04_CG TaxID=2842121 RepID=UPI001C5A96BD|nr:helix-turn-helix domain-containing protein [Flavobacterium sp. NKUCC04_CG]MBW3519816.1 helix-turn-helix domain-containing protein [Flavobacterium sp. NKUCC04_CG]
MSLFKINSSLLNHSTISKLHKRSFGILFFGTFLIVFEIFILYKYSDISLLLLNGALALVSLKLLDKGKWSTINYWYLLVPFTIFILYVFAILNFPSTIFCYIYLGLIFGYGVWNLIASSRFDNYIFRVWLNLGAIFQILIAVVILSFRLNEYNLFITEFDPRFVVSFFLVMTAVLNLFFYGFLLHHRSLLNEMNTENLCRETVDINILETDIDVQRINTFFAESKEYLDPNFSFDDFATALKQSKKDLSEILNHKLGVNFYTILGEKRIAVAKRLIDENYDKFTIDFVMQESGFYSKSAFNRNFKKFIGMTPSEYRNSVK